jgi:hypothetical protein
MDFAFVRCQVRVRLVDGASMDDASGESLR